MSSVLLFLTLSITAGAVRDDATTNPLSKVIELMDSLSAKITAEGEAEAKAFKEYVEWCDDAAANLHYEIKTGAKNKEDLEASIGKATADISASDTKIEELSASISADETELKEATAVREKEVATFEAREKELVDLKEKAEGQLADLRKAESATKHNYNMLKQSLTDQMEADGKDMSEEKTFKASTEESKAVAEGDLAETVKGLAEDKKALETASTTCMSVAADHEATVKSRTEELTAIATAKKVLGETTSGAESQTYSFIQVVSQAGSRLQTRADLANIEVINLVKKLARDHHSAALAQLASRIGAVIRFGAAAGDDPFAKVKSLISDMISKLETEAKSEATEKDYCDEELAKTEAKKIGIGRCNHEADIKD
jgi:chromosome segregation ATPase